MNACAVLQTGKKGSGKGAAGAAKAAAAKEEEDEDDMDADALRASAARYESELNALRAEHSQLLQSAGFDRTSALREAAQDRANEWQALAEAQAQAESNPIGPAPPAAVAALQTAQALDAALTEKLQKAVALQSRLEAVARDMKQKQAEAGVKEVAPNVLQTIALICCCVLQRR